MGLVILFRRDNTTSPFRTAALNFIKYKSGKSKETLIIGSGYVDSSIIDSTTEDKGYSKTELIEAIHEGYNNQDSVYIISGSFKSHICTGTRSSDICWRCNFYNFIKILKSELYKKSSNVNIEQIDSYHQTKNKWHAKIMIKIADGIPYAFLIGSSNLTSSAFENPETLNFECDILIYPNNHRGIFDANDFPKGTVLSTRPMSIEDVEFFSQTFIKDLIDSKIINEEKANEIFNSNYLNKVREINYRNK